MSNRHIISEKHIKMCGKYKCVIDFNFARHVRSPDLNVARAAHVYIIFLFECVLYGLGQGAF